MARRDMPNEDIERVLRDHFRVEASELRAPGDPWDWLQSRLEPQPRPPFLRRLLSTRRGRFYAVSGTAATFAVAVMVAWTAAWMVVDGTESDQPRIAMVSEESGERLMAASVSEPGSSLPRPPWMSTRSSVTADPVGPRGEPGLPGLPGQPGNPGVSGSVAPAGPAAESEAMLMEEPGVAMAPVPPAPVPPIDKGPAPDAPESVTEEAAGPLSAGEIDDNERWEDYLRYRENYEGPPIHDVDVSERYTVTVVDSLDHPIPNARVRVSSGGNSIFEGRTYANGQTLFFPLAFPEAVGVETFLLEVEKDGASGSLDFERGQGFELNVELDLDAATTAGVPLDVLFLLDATGSMADEIDQIKDTLLSISARIGELPSRPDLRFGMVAYRDRGDEFITRVYDFDHDVQKFSNTIREVVADGGGDDPESLNEALHVAVHEPSWRLDNAIRLVFLVADAPPHLDYAQDYDYAEEMVEANRRGIKIFAIASSGLDSQGEYVFRQIAQHTMGRFIFIVYGAGGTTPHHVGQYTIEQLDDLVVRLVQEELAFLAQ